MIQSRSVLKSYFERNDKPSQQQFSDLMDSLVHKTEDGIIISKTRQQVLDLMAAGSLQPGMIYYLTDKKIWLTALSTNQISNEGYLLYDKPRKARGFVRFSSGAGNIVNIVINEVEICPQAIYNTDLETTIDDAVTAVNVGTGTHGYRAWRVLDALCLEHTEGGTAGNGDIEIDTTLSVLTNSGMVSGQDAFTFLVKVSYYIDFHNILSLYGIPVSIFPTDIIYELFFPFSTTSIRYSFGKIIMCAILIGVLPDILNIDVYGINNSELVDCYFGNALFISDAIDSSSLRNVYMNSLCISNMLFYNSQLISEDTIDVKDIISIKTTEDCTFKNISVNNIASIENLKITDTSNVSFYNIKFDGVSKSIENIELHGSSCFNFLDFENSGISNLKLTDATVEYCYRYNADFGGLDENNILDIDGVRIINQDIDNRDGIFQIALELDGTANNGDIGSIIANYLPEGAYIHEAIIDFGTLTSTTGKIAIGLNQSAATDCVMVETIHSNLSDKVIKVSAPDMIKADAANREVILSISEAPISGNIHIICKFSL